jgi:hypothetical protein
MELKCFRTLWGVTPWPQTLDELQRVGCCGIEARVPLTVAERRQLADACRRRGWSISPFFSAAAGAPAQHETPSSIWRACSRFAEASAQPALCQSAGGQRSLAAGAAGRFSRQGTSWPPGLV